jgi:hypothetical protein
MLRRDAPGEVERPRKSRQSSEAALPFEVDMQPFGGVGELRLGKIPHEPFEVVDRLHDFAPSSPVGGAVALVCDDVNVNPGSDFKAPVARSSEGAAEGSQPSPESPSVEDAARVGVFGLEPQVIPVKREEGRRLENHGDTSSPPVTISEGFTGGGAAGSGRVVEEVGRVIRIPGNIGSALFEGRRSSEGAEGAAALFPEVARHVFTSRERSGRIRS